MDYYDKNIEEIKKQGFEKIDFYGYGGTGYKKGELEIWWHEWGYAYIELKRGGKSKREIQLCHISKQSIADKLKEAIIELNK